MRFPGFIGPSYKLQSVNVDCQRTVNMFPEMNALGTGKEREVASLVPTPGLRLLLTLGEGPVRGLWRASNGQVFAVGGTKFYRISSAWVATELGTLNTASGPVSIADNGTHVLIVDGTNGYSWTIATDTFAVIVDVDFQTADQVTFQDGHFILNATGTNDFFFSELNDVAFDALDIGSAEGSPDLIVGLISHNQNLWLFGSQSTEVFYNAGGLDGFVRINGAIIEAGCSAKFSIARVGGYVYWVGGDENGSGIVYRAQQYQAERISTPSIESVIRGVSADNLANARAWTYQQGGHEFYCLNIPTVNATWVYDASTGLWHERSYLDELEPIRHRADCHAVAHGLNVVGDFETGGVYELAPETYTDNGTAIVRERTAPHFSNGLRKIFHHSFQLDMETGVGLSGSGQGIAPMAMIQWSDDGGHTWSNERWTSIGAIGKTRTRVKWNRLGSARDRVYRLKVSEPVKVVLVGAELEIEEGAA